MREVKQPTINEHGDDTHPAYGWVHVNRAHVSNPGAVLFDSEIRHQEIVTLRISQASQKRDLHRNWIHEGKTFIEIEMSMAQWAALVSSFGGSGVPVTIRRTETEMIVPGLPFKPVLGESLAEVRGAARDLLADIKRARDDYEAAIARKAGAKELKALRSTLHYLIENGEANVTFAAKSLNEHAENVVTKARADIEATVARHAEQLSIEERPRPRGRNPQPRVLDAEIIGEIEP